MSGYSKRSAVSEVSVKEGIFCFNRVVVKKHGSVSAEITSVSLTHSLPCLRPVSHREGPGSIRGHFVWDLWWTLR